MQDKDNKKKFIEKTTMTKITKYNKTLLLNLMEPAVFFVIFL